jgi:hypothetical protein
MGETMDKVLASIPALVILGILSLCELLAMCIPVIDEFVDAILVWIVPFFSLVTTLGSWGIYYPGSENGENRLLEEDGSGLGYQGFIQVFAVITGMGIALAIRLIKMLVRLLGEGWLTSCITCVEAVLVTFCVIISVYMKYIAIFFAIGLFVGIGWYWTKGRKRGEEKRKEKEESERAYGSFNDPENQGEQKQEEQA